MRSPLWLGVYLLIVLGLAQIGVAPAHAEQTSPDSPVWPAEMLMQRAVPSHNSAWGTAFDSDINWTFDSGGDNLFTETVVVDGIAYVGSESNKIYALDAVTGKLLWTFIAN